ncbi:MAG: DUF4097 family beta strand repeat-containing protein [Planctomycetota bacterium]|jgi:hypothetical protein
MRRTTALLAVILLSAALLPGCVSNHRVSRTEVLQADHEAGTAINVHSRNGAITVVADAKREDIRIESRLTCTGGSVKQAEERLAAARVIVERRDDRTLSVRAAFPDGGRSGDGAVFTIRMPEAVNATLRTSNGRIRANGLSGELSATTSNGPVVVEDHDGPADVHTSNGRIEVTGHKGAANLNTSNGAVQVRLHADSPGPLTVRSSNGSIRAAVGPAFGGTIDCDTSNGRIHVDGSDRARIIHINRSDGYLVVGEDETPRSRLDTSNGSITIELR